MQAKISLSDWIAIVRKNDTPYRENYETILKKQNAPTAKVFFSETVKLVEECQKDCVG